MFNRTKINALIGLVGFENPSNPDYNLVNSVVSRSGRYFTDNPYCKIEYIKDCQDYYKQTKNQFNTLLSKIQKTAILNVCDRVFSNDDLLEREVVYPYAKNNVNTETLPDGFVGFRIKKRSNKAFKIERILTNFSNTGSFTLYLYSSNQPTALFSETVTIDTTGFQIVPLTNWIVDNTVNYEGEYYLGYVKNSLVPYKHDYENSDTKAYYYNLEIESIKVADHSGATLFDINDIEGLSENSGINPDISVYEDYTDNVLRNEYLFGEAVQLAGQIDIIRLVLSSIRSNQHQRLSGETANQMVFELEGNPDIKIYGLRSKYEQSIKKLKDNYKQERKIKMVTQS